MDKKIIIAGALAVVAAVFLLLVLMAPTPETSASPVARDTGSDSKTNEYNIAFSDAGTAGRGSGGNGGSGPGSLNSVSAAATTSTEGGVSASMGPVTVSEQIEEAVVMYSPEAVDLIAPHLASSDPDTREEAVEGLIQLGEPSGAKLLRKQAASATDPRFRARLLQAAEFIELPPAVFFSTDN